MRFIFVQKCLHFCSFDNKNNKTFEKEKERKRDENMF